MATVLIVEDQQDVQKLLGVVLQAPGRRLLHAFDGEQGLALARSERPELILLDIMMPGAMDGLTLLRTLRAEPAGVGIKVVMMSARTQRKDIEIALADGADDYLCKPFRLTDLKKILDRYLPPAGPSGK